MAHENPSDPSGEPPPLGPRLLEFGLTCCELAEALPHTPVCDNIERQLGRSSMAAVSNYSEAQGASSRHDFIHKLHMCEKELRETGVWLAAAKRLSRVKRPDPDALLREWNELVSIVVASRKTARRNEREEEDDDQDDEGPNNEKRKKRKKPRR